MYEAFDRRPYVQARAVELAIAAGYRLAILVNDCEASRHRTAEMESPTFK